MTYELAPDGFAEDPNARAWKRAAAAGVPEMQIQLNKAQMEADGAMRMKRVGHVKAKRANSDGSGAGPPRAIKLSGRSKRPREPNADGAFAPRLRVDTGDPSAPTSGRSGTADKVTEHCVEKIKEMYTDYDPLMNKFKEMLITGSFDSPVTPAKADQHEKRIQRFIWLNIRASQVYPDIWPLPGGTLLDLMKARSRDFKTGGSFEEFAFSHPKNDESGGMPWVHRPKHGNHSSCQDQHTSVEKMLDLVIGTNSSP